MTGGLPPGDRGRRPRRLRLKADGRLYDLDEHRHIGLDELCDDVRSGRSFRAHRQHTGAECTNEVLVEVLRSTLPRCAQAAPDALARVLDRPPQTAADPVGRRHTTLRIRGDA
ncbi:hypothetical protein HS041_26005 [Planomonospora sp. ID67723]|uniref:polyhydroxyalkanoate synthesis regulator DNA-binding domain-containing protein n=1 Tax=Planomonospora sp. ID67723 TaxID=2738134 RepID=UPI0018C42A42|nr:polyhydroxyalkanoate synthesis regulator DNA-binding domain-containing protein [Planomonospora sp. ID67723]MBG0831211.1 hypothetical protein [Planomonospora sp. ID67723]